LAHEVNANKDQVEHECIALIRKLIERGFVTVTPVSGGMEMATGS
jgi:glycine/serine hydroxymethyltransferase